MGTRKNFFEEILDFGYDIISGPGTLYRNTGANSTRLVPIRKWLEMLDL